MPSPVQRCLNSVARMVAFMVGSGVEGGNGTRAKLLARVAGMDNPLTRNWRGAGSERSGLDNDLKIVAL
jgi:hypothetical protein